MTSKTQSQVDDQPSHPFNRKYFRGLRLACTLLAAGLSACNRDGTTAGQKLDRALDRTGEAVKDAGEAIKPK